MELPPLETTINVPETENHEPIQQQQSPEMEQAPEQAQEQAPEQAQDQAEDLFETDGLQRSPIRKSRRKRMRPEFFQP